MTPKLPNEDTPKPEDAKPDKLNLPDDSLYGDLAAAEVRSQPPPEKTDA